MKHFPAIASLIVILVGVVWLATPLPSPLFSNNYSTVIVDRNGKLLRVFLNEDEQWRFPPANEEIPKNLVTTAIAYEDKRFFCHIGFDPISLIRALIQNIRAGKIISGGSTITMQVARICKPKKRTIINKIVEIFQSVKIELLYSKKDILRLYFNNAPYGGNIIGYRAACLRYWGKDPKELTWAEAATLAILPNNPSLINPPKNIGLLEKNRNKLLKKIHEKGYIDRETYELALLEPTPELQVRFPFYAPHLSFNLAGKKIRGEIKTTIDFNIQKNVELLAKEHAKRLNSEGIKNLAVIVAETRTGKVRAYIGSQGYEDKEREGMIDGVRAPRSTGTILKPFLYALAIDDAIIVPETRIRDIPTFYGSFAPNNADNDFRGIVTAREALIQSLNVPAVRLLYTYGVPDFLGFLKKAGMTTLFRTADEYGLPLILGGAEGTLWDITAMFRALGNYGKFSGLQVLENDSLPAPKQLISAGACYLVLDILADLNRPESEYYWELFSDRYPIAWKTGTSYGHRDAWAIGVSPEWTIGVWTGNFTGEGTPNLAGARSSGTLLFQIFQALPKNPENALFHKPTTDLVKIKICPESGYLATPECPNPIEVDAPPTSKSLPLCSFHKKIFTTKDGKYRVCSLCWDLNDKKEQIYTVYPPEVIQHLKTRGHSFIALPPHKPDCPSQSTMNLIEIIYPTQRSIIIVPKGLSEEYEKIIAKAAYSGAKGELYWYLDNIFIGATIDEHNIPLDLTNGWHNLQAIDQEGHFQKVRFKAERK